MKRSDYELMSIDALWALHSEITTRLAARMSSEKRLLEERLNRLNQPGANERPAKAQILPLDGARRPYPMVVPKYRNTDEPGETWSGRGSGHVGWSASSSWAGS